MALLTRNTASLHMQEHTDAHRASLDRREGRCGRAARHRYTQRIRQLACEPCGAGCRTQILTGIRQQAFEQHCIGYTAQLAICSWPSRAARRPEESALVQAGFSTCACAFASDLAAPERHLFRRSLAHACVHIARNAMAIAMASLSDLKSARSGALQSHTRCVQGTDAC